jgi:hypothetical protein
MGVFVGKLNPEVESFLSRFANKFPPALYDNLIRICGDPLPDRDLLPWIRRDLDQKLKLLDADSRTERQDIERFLANDDFTFMNDLGSLLDIASASRNFDAIYVAESNYVIDHCGNDPKMFALLEALYHIATNYALAHAIASPILNGKINLENYFEIYLRGGDYVVSNDSIVVWQYQATQSE